MMRKKRRRRKSKREEMIWFETASLSSSLSLSLSSFEIPSWPFVTLAILPFHRLLPSASPSSVKVNVNRSIYASVCCSSLSKPLS